MAAIDVRSAIESSTLLGSLPEADRVKLATAATVKVAQKGEVIWFGGEQHSHFALIDRGFVKMSRTNAHGQDVALELVGPGQCFGLNGLLDGQGCPLTATALTKLRYLKILSQDILPIVESNVEFRDFMFRRLMRRFHDKLELLACMASGRVPSRIAAVLLTLLSTYGMEVEGGVAIRVPLTRSEIAELAGTTTESAIRTLSKWQKDGLIATEHHHIVVLDTLELERMVE